MRENISREFAKKEYSRAVDAFLDYLTSSKRGAEAKVPSRRGPSELTDDAFYRGERRDAENIPPAGSEYDAENLARRGGGAMTGDALYRGEKRGAREIPLSDGDSAVKNLGRRLRSMYRNSGMSEGYYGN